MGCLLMYSIDGRGQPPLTRGSALVLRRLRRADYTGARPPPGTRRMEDDLGANYVTRRKRGRASDYMSRYSSRRWNDKTGWRMRCVLRATVFKACRRTARCRPSRSRRDLAVARPRTGAAPLSRSPAPRARPWMFLLFFLAFFGLFVVGFSLCLLC